DGHVDALDVHRLELDFRRPAALGERPPALLIERVVATLTSPAPIRVDRDATPRLSVKGEAQIAFILREADRRAVAEFGIDVPRPEIGGFDDVNVAVENLEGAVGHGSPPCAGTVTPASLVVKAAFVEGASRRPDAGQRDAIKLVPPH